MSLLNVPFVRFRLLVLCHDPQSHRPRLKGVDKTPVPLLVGVECLAAWPIRRHTQVLSPTSTPT